jgi:hypothetical protein
VVFVVFTLVPFNVVAVKFLTLVISLFESNTTALLASAVPGPVVR